MKQKNSTIKLITTIIGWSLFGISAILAILFYVKGVSGDTVNQQWVDLVIKWAYILAVIAAILAFIVVPIFNAIQNTKALIKFGIAIVVFLIFMLIAYSLSSATGVPNVNNIENFESIVLWVDTGLHMFYILTVIGILVILGAEIKNIIK